MRLVRVTGLRHGKLYVAGARIHHGLIGALVAVVAISRKPHPRFRQFLAIVVGLLAMVHDWRDFPWLNDRDAFRFSPSN